MESSHNLDNNVENNKNNTEIFILSVLEKSFLNNNIKELNFNIPIKKRKNENSKVDSDDNITLFNALYNSLINKDNKSFLFCIQQKNETLIEETVKQMNNDCIEKFIEKSLDIFQSNSYSIYVKSILSWIKNVIKFKKIYLLSKNNIENLLKIQIYIKDKIKCFNNLSLLKQKMEKMNTILYPAKGNKDNFFKKNDNINNNMENSNKPIIFEPLLTYYESEDEDETKENKIKKNKMEIIGFEEMEKEISEENNEEMEEEKEKEESDEDDFDEEISNMDIEEKDIIKNKKNINKEIIDLDEDEDEENKDDIEEDEDDE